jgi:hypothetical protein
MNIKEFFNKKISFDFIMGILIAAAIILVTLMLTGKCSANEVPENIPTMVYGDCDEEVNYIPLYTDGIIEFAYTHEDGYDSYVIDYSDDDSFDYENMLHNGEPWYGNYIMLSCSKEVFFEYLTWYSNTINNENCEEDNNDSFCIKEVITDTPEGKNYRHWLIRSSDRI